MRKIKVHFFFRRPVPGDHFSIERFFDGMTSTLPTDRFEIHRLICPFESRGLLRRLASIVWAALHQADINHITGDVNYLGLLMRRKNTVLTICDSASMTRLTGLHRWIYRLIWLRLPLWHCARVTVISECTLKETLSYVNSSPSKFVVIPCCLALGIKTSPYTFSQKLPRFLIVGTKPNKNLPRIMQALKGISCRVVIVGVLSESQLRLVADLKLDVENHVELDDDAVAEQYRAAHAVLFVSTYEGFGLPILEAQAAGRPLITSRRSPMQEVAGVGSCLADPEDIDDIHQKVLRVIKDQVFREALVFAGTENVQRYAPAVIGSRYAALYEDVLDGRIL
jgi:glycosyltransferase involved in cell wall biosynthesis